MSCVSTVSWLQLGKAPVVPMVTIAMGRCTYFTPIPQCAYIPLYLWLATMHLYCLPPLCFPLQGCTCTPHLWQSQLQPVTEGFLTTAWHACAATISHLHPGEPEGQGWGLLHLAAQPAGILGESPPSQPPAWLTPGRPCSGSEYTLVLSHWLPGRKGFGEEEEKGGNRARKTTPGFLHPQETSWTHTRETTSLLSSCCASCKNYLKCRKALLL